jgi:hypothetical protein
MRQQALSERLEGLFSPGELNTDANESGWEEGS